MKRYLFTSSIVVCVATVMGLFQVPAFQNPRGASVRTAAQTQGSSKAAQSSGATKTVSLSSQQITPDSDVFMITFVNGAPVCRQATPEEATQVLRRDPKTTLHVINPGSLTSRSATPQAAGMKIVLRGTDQLEAFPDAKQAFIRAAAHWETLINNPITIVLDVDFGPTRFGVPFGALTLGSTAVQSLTATNGYQPIKDAFALTQPNSVESQLYGLLPNNTLPTDIGPVVNMRVASPNLRALGLIDATADPDGAEAAFGAPPSIGFNSNFHFDLDPSDGIQSELVDFDAVVTHEIGHAIGFITRVGANTTSTPSATPWDIFRFRPGTTLATFQTANRILTVGGGGDDQEFFNGVADVPTSTGSPSGTGGDGEQGSHWKDDAKIGGRYIGIMDPVLPTGKRELISDDDLTMLDIIGYSINRNSQTTDELSADDGTAEILTQSAGIAVNRLTPVAYPSTLRKIRVFIKGNGTSPAGSIVRFLAYTAANPGVFGQNGSSRPVVDQTVVLPDPGANGTFVELNIPQGPTINSGDWYVGFQIFGSLVFAGDTSGPQTQRTFTSNDGLNFQQTSNFTTTTGNNVAANLMLRAVESSSGCPFTLTPNSQNPTNAGGASAFGVTTNGGCSWTARSSDTWITTTSAGTGNGTVTFAVAPNGDTVSRTGFITVGDQFFTITQDPGVVLSTHTDQATVPAAPPTPADSCTLFSTQFQVVVPANALQLKVDLDGGSNDVDLYVRFNQQVTGSSPEFDADFASNGPTGQESVKINGTTFPVLNAGTYFIGVANCSTSESPITLTTTLSGTNLCLFNVVPVNLTFPGSGGQSTASVTTTAGCTWTASSNDPFVTITSGASGNGNGTVGYSVAANPNQVARSAILTIAGQIFNVTQNPPQKSDQTITFDPLPNRTMGETAFPLVATSSSGLPVSFSILTPPVPPNAVILTINGVISVGLVSVGQVTVRATQAGNATFNAAPPVDRTFTISKGNQTISFLPLTNRTFGDAPFTVSALSSSLLPVSFSVKSGPATISNGNLVTMTGAGTVTIQADQAGNSNFNAAAPVTQSFTVAQLSQTITFTQPTNHVFGDFPFFLSASATSGLGVTFSVISGPAILSGNGVTVIGAGTVTIQADQAGNANFSAAPGVQRTFTVAKANQTITFDPLANKNLGDPTFTINATSTSGQTVTFSVVSGPATIIGNFVSLTAAGTVVIQADQVGDANFNPAAPVQRSFTVSKGQAFINLTNLIQIFDGSPKLVTATTTPPELSGLTVTYNGSPNPPSAIGSYSVVASLNNPDFQATNFVATLNILGFSSSTQNVNPGSQNTANIDPDGGSPGVSANLNHTNGGATATVSVGVYTGNPTERGLVNAGGGFVDVKVTNSNAGDTVVVNYYYPNTVTAANEAALQLYFFNGLTWQLVKGSGNATPIKDTTDNLDGTVSSGRFTVTLDNTSSPKVSNLTGTVFAATTAIMGDITGDNVVNITDLVLMANILAGNFTPTPVQKDAADVLKDGTNHITVGDLFTLANFLAGNTKTLPLGN